MNLYFRLFYLIIQSFFLKKENRLRVFREKFMVLPSDCDINIHMTNSRYLSFADLARTKALMEMGVLKKLLKRGWNAVVSAQEITFIKPLLPFQRFEMETEIICWDEKYWYIEHRYMHKGRLCATALIRGAFIQGRKVVSTQQVLALIGITDRSPLFPERIEHFKYLLVKKKEESVV
jgi:acyl-CoA thioesterase FadM